MADRAGGGALSRRLRHEPARGLSPAPGGSARRRGRGLGLAALRPGLARCDGWPAPRVLPSHQPRLGPPLRPAPLPALSFERRRVARAPARLPPLPLSPALGLGRA